MKSSFPAVKKFDRQLRRWECRQASDHNSNIPRAKEDGNMGFKVGNGLWMPCVRENNSGDRGFWGGCLRLFETKNTKVTTKQKYGEPIPFISRYKLRMLFVLGSFLSKLVTYSQEEQYCEIDAKL